MKSAKINYSVFTHEPGYNESTELVTKNASMNQVISQIYKLRRNYLADPENNASYVFIELEIEPEIEIEGDTQVFASHFNVSNFPNIWEIRHNISEATKILIKEVSHAK